jgi:hypothetical protein
MPAEIPTTGDEDWWNLPSVVPGVSRRDYLATREGNDKPQTTDLQPPEFLVECGEHIAPVLRRRDGETREQFIARIRRVEDAANV